MGLSPAAVSVPVDAEQLKLQRADRQILSGCDLRVAAGESIAITGRSGAGKSTLLWVLLGLMTPDSGTVTIAGEPMTGVSGRQRASLRRSSVGVVFQQPELIPELSALENAALPLLLSGSRPREARDRAGKLLGQVGVDPSTLASRLSGGEQQRVAVARALVNQPAVVLADEPTGSLDEESAAVVVRLLVALTESAGSALVVVTHDHRVAAAMGSALSLEAGRLRGRELLRAGTW